MKLRNFYLCMCFFTIYFCNGALIETEIQNNVNDTTINKPEIETVKSNVYNIPEAESEQKDIYKIQARVNGVWSTVDSKNTEENSNTNDNNHTSQYNNSAVHSKNGSMHDQPTKEEQNIENNKIRKFQDINQFAKFISGVSIVKNNDSYTNHFNILNENWQKIHEYCFSKIINFEKSELREKSSNIDTVFYPFGGPDAAHAVMLFPTAKKYILIGQERTGRAIDTQNEVTDEILQAIRQSISSFLLKGYFITMSMATDLHNKHISGTMTIILLNLSRLGYEIKSVSNSKLISKNDDSIKIVFFNPITKEEKTLYYIQSQLQNNAKGLEKLLTFITKESNSMATIIKSCSYCMHMSEFSKLRDLITRRSNVILQDDSGIPVHMIDKSIFDIALYGSYMKPTLGVFRLYAQPSLASMYLNKENVKQIDFPIGYICESKLKKHDFTGINLQVFTRKAKDNR